MDTYYRQPTHDTAAAALADALGLLDSDRSDDPSVPEKSGDEGAGFEPIGASLERPVPKFPGLVDFTTGGIRRS